MLPALATILYATDLGRTAPGVLRYALSLARAYGGNVVAVHAVEPLGPSAGPAAPSPAYSSTMCRADGPSGSTTWRQTTRPP